MSKRSSGSSRRGGQVKKKGRSTKVQMTLNDAQLKKMKRSSPGRPPLGDEPRKMISIKLDTKLLSNLKAEAKKDGKPYQSLIHEILEKYMRKNAA